MKKTIYVFEDYRDEAPEGAKLTFNNKKEAMETYNNLLEMGCKVFNFGTERIIFPTEKKGTKKVTYGIYDDHGLQSLS